MKKFFVITALVLAASPVVIDPVFAAQKKGVFCKTAEQVADAGFFFSVSPDYKTATLNEETFAGMRHVADLECELLPTRQHPDSLDNYLVCNGTKNVPDDGIVVRVFAGGIAGLHYASVRSLTMHGEEEEMFGNLNCKQ